VEWEIIDDLAEDLDRIERIQRRTLTTEDGLVADPAPLGTPEWWSAIEGGQLRTEWFEGPISKVYWGSMNDWPEFAVDAQGDASTWTREGDITRYVGGLTSSSPLSSCDTKDRSPSDSSSLKSC
jgi:hypothetical protein